MGTWVALSGSVNLEANTTMADSLYGDKVNIKGGAQLTSAPSFELFIQRFLEDSLSRPGILTEVTSSISQMELS